MLKGRAFQLVLTQEVQPDNGKCERSQITGEMKLTLPKVRQNPRLVPVKEVEKITINENAKKNSGTVNYRTIVQDNEAELERLKAQRMNELRPKKPEPRKNDEGFEDSDDVPPLI